MVQTIASTVGGTERRRALMIHAGGLVLGSGVMAAGLFLVGTGLRTLLGEEALVYAAGIASLIWAVTTALGRGAPYPRSGWQVPETWRQTLPFRFTVGAYGVLLGLGFLTDVVLPTFWILVALSLALPSLVAVLVAWFAYAAGRAIWTWRESQDAGDPTCSVTEPGQFRLARYGSASVLVLIAVAVVL